MREVKALSGLGAALTLTLSRRERGPTVPPSRDISRPRKIRLHLAPGDG